MFEKLFRSWTPIVSLSLRYSSETLSKQGKLISPVYKYQILAHKQSLELLPVHKRNLMQLSKITQPIKDYVKKESSDFKDFMPKIPRTLAGLYLTYLIGAEITEILNERQAIRDVLKKARAEVDAHRLNTQKHLDEIQAISKSLSRTATASSDKRYTTDQIEQEILSLDRAIEELEVYLKRIDQIEAPKFDILTNPISIKSEVDKLACELHEQILKLNLAKFIVTATHYFKRHDFENGIKKFYTGLLLLNKIISIEKETDAISKNKEKSKDTSESLIRALYNNTEISTLSNSLLPPAALKTPEQILVTIEEVKKLINDRKKINSNNKIKNTWHERTLANLINGLALTIRYRSEKTETSCDLFALSQTLIKFYAIANELFPCNPILEANYAIILNRAGKTDDFIIFAKKAYNSGCQDPVVWNCYALSLMETSLNNPKRIISLYSALNIFNRIIIEYPDTPSILNNRGLLYFLLYNEENKKEHLENSLIDLNNAEILSPQDEMILFHRATTKFNLKIYVEAELDLNVAEEKAPYMRKEPLFLYLLAGIYSHTHRKMEAKKLLLEAKKLVIGRQKDSGDQKVPIRFDEYAEPADAFLEKIELGIEEIEIKIEKSEYSITKLFVRLGIFSVPQSESSISAPANPCNTSTITLKT